MKDLTHDIVRINKTLSTSTRLTTLLMLIEGKRPWEIAKVVGVTKSAISVAIRILIKEGLIEQTKRVKGSEYIVPPKTVKFIDQLVEIIGELIRD